MNTIETVQALVARYETCAAETDAALRSARALLAQMQTEPIKAGSLDDALYSPDGSFGGAQSPTPVAPTFDEWWENHGKYNALFKFDHNASPSDRLARAKELMSLSWEVARESPAPVAVQPSQSDMRAEFHKWLKEAELLVQAVTNAACRCGMWEDEDETPYNTLFERAQACRADLLAHLRKALRLPMGDVGEEFTESNYGGTADVVIAMSKEIQRLRAALSSRMAALHEWQDIATAPKDGVFLVFMPQERPDDQIQVAKWHPNVKVIGGCFAFDRKPVTHFHALPPSPLSSSPEDKK